MKIKLLNPRGFPNLLGLSMEGLDFRSIGRILEVSNVTVVKLVVGEQRQRKTLEKLADKIKGKVCTDY